MELKPEYIDFRLSLDALVKAAVDAGLVDTGIVAALKDKIAEINAGAALSAD